MWGNVMVVFVFSHYLVEAVHCHNEPEQKLLCNIFRQSERVLQKFVDTELLKEAIYGPTKGNALISKDGNLTLSSSCHTPVLRNEYCKYSRSERAKDGCFAESLLGTFFCICAPGAQRVNVNNLCGVDITRNFYLWHGPFPPNEGDIEELFDSVWKDVISNCTGESESVGSGNEELEKLRKAVEDVENTIKQDRNSFYYYLGGSGEKDCSGSDGKNVCAAYRKKDGIVSKAHIPWVKKIKEAITQLQKVERERQDLDFMERTTRKQSESIAAPAHHAGKGNAELTDQREGIVTPPNSSRTLPKTEISTKTSPITNIPHLATYLNEDGSLLTNQKWLVIAAFLN
ncbi:Variant surface glycoprotein [Trypanosoma congolense IL3000]|uniref:Variant surface glycoprotein n=1 Tax=Trypanosoma congolense (strain IL3000) TaxID=1068625 RepID=F9W717_TRYCI|nr:Variant surface glycoprotein [Trypanosoma congolense IL3000]